MFIIVIFPGQLTVKALHLHATEYLHDVLEMMWLEKTNSEGIVTK